MVERTRAVRGDRVLLDLLSDKWTIAVLGSMCDNGYRRRFNAIRRDVPEISQKSLSRCLRRLEEYGLIQRVVLSDEVLGVEYRFTDLGRTIEKPVAALFEWTLNHGEKVKKAQAAHRLSHGRG